MNIEKRRFVKPKKVFICSPFAPRGETKEEMQKDMDRNIRITQKACRFAALNGNVPYAPHLFFTQFLKDSDKTEREYGQIMGLIWLAQCSELWIIGRRISPGMEKEIKKAKEWGIPCFYNTISESTYLNNGYGKFSYEDESLIFDTDSYLEEIPINRLTASAFRQYGFDDFPRDVIISRLVNPTLYHWQDTDIELPPISAKITAIPPVQLVYSKNTEMNDSTILGIESVEIDSDDNTLFAFSFDGGTTWKAYTEGKWAVLSEETSGMNRESIKAVGTDAWNEAAADRQYKIRFALREGGYVNKIVVHYLN